MAYFVPAGGWNRPGSLTDRIRGFKELRAPCLADAQMLIFAFLLQDGPLPDRQSVMD